MQLVLLTVPGQAHYEVANIAVSRVVRITGTAPPTAMSDAASTADSSRSNTSEVANTAVSRTTEW